MLGVGRVVRLAAAAVAVFVLTGNDAAQAECLYAVVYVSRENAEPLYANGPQGCVTATDWRQRVFLPSSLGHGGLPDGTPNGYFVDLRVPVPG
jgi:hypothetical protein